MTLEKVFAALVNEGRIELTGDSVLAKDLRFHGIEIVGDEARLPKDVRLLEPKKILERLRPEASEWLSSLRLLAHVESTNQCLMKMAEHAPIDGRVLIAEVQTGGRGRRGRTWISPFGRNIAMSIGMGLACPSSGIGAVSLVIGLAIAEVLRTVGVRNVELKWPNDVLIEGQKVSGILIELTNHSRPVEIVIVVGINIGARGLLMKGVEHEVADVADQIPDLSRSVLAGEIINLVHLYCREFERFGFRAFRDRWLDLHAYQDRRVVAVSGSGTIHGICRGISLSGALLIDDGEELIELIGGEITIRKG